MPLIGYARVSTEDQTPLPQSQALKSAGCAEIHEELASGGNRARPVLARVLLDGLAQEIGRPAIGLAPDALAALARYPWPGNIRELRNVLERAALLGDGTELRAAQLRFESGFGTPPAPAAGDLGGLTLKELERQQIERVLREEKGKVEPAARRLGIPRSSLYQKLKQYQIAVPRA